jgi:MFS family permease
LLASLGPCLIFLARDLEVPRSKLSWLSGGFGTGLVVAGVIGERLLHVGTWRLVRFSAASMAFGVVLLAFALKIPLIQAGALLLGLGGAGVVLVCPVLLAGPGAAAQLTFANAMSSIAGIGAPLLLSVADAALGWPRAALLLPVPGLIWLCATRSPPVRPVPLPPAREKRARTPARLRVATARGWLALSAVIFPEFFFVVWGAARLQDSGLGAAQASAAAAAFPVGMALGRLAAPRVIDRIPLAWVGVAVATVGALLASAPFGPVVTVAALTLAGLGISPLYPMLIDELVRTPGLDLSRGAALGALASGVSVLGAPLLLAALAGVLSLRIGFLAAVPLLVAGLLLSRRDWRRGVQEAGQSRPQS